METKIYLATSRSIKVIDTRNFSNSKEQEAYRIAQAEEIKKQGKKNFILFLMSDGKPVGASDVWDAYIWGSVKFHSIFYKVIVQYLNEQPERSQIPEYKNLVNAWAIRSICPGLVAA